MATTLTPTPAPKRGKRAKALGNGTAPAEQQVQIVLPQLDIHRAVLTVVGDSPLISHRWSEKAKKEMLDKQMKRAKTAKSAKDPVMDFVESLYWLTAQPTSPEQVTQALLEQSRFGFPAVAFKSAAVDACSHIDGVTKVEARGAFHIEGEMVEIVGTPSIREDMVRVGNGVADIRYRGEFKGWSATFLLRYNANVLSLEQVANLFNTAGFAIGVGEWRPQRDGSYGMFHVGEAPEPQD